MRIQQNRPTQVQITLHPYEMATLLTAARWVVEGASGELPPEAIAQLKQVLANYDKAPLKVNPLLDHGT